MRALPRVLAALLLCAAAASAGDAPRKVALFKTHKTSGTTLGAVLFRYAALRSSRIFTAGNASAECAAGFEAAGCLRAHALTPLPALGAAGPHADVVLHHVSMSGNLSGATFGDVLRFYAAALVGTAAADAPQPLLLVPVREPVARFASFFHFYGRFRRLPAAPGAPTLQDWIDARAGADGFAAEFGLRTAADTDAFLELLTAPDAVRRTGGLRPFFFPSERFDDALLVLGSLLNFTWQDSLYVRLQNSGAYEPPSAAQRDAIRAQTTLDARIYAATTASFERDFGAVQARIGAASWRRSQAALASRLKTLRSSVDDSSSLSAACQALGAWYQRDDLAYESSVDEVTWRAPVPPVARRRAMAEAFRQSNGSRFC